MFSLFTKLPPEIRDEIWLIALTQWSVTMATRYRHDELPDWQASTSSIGQTCREARSTMTRVFSKIQFPQSSHPLRLHFETNILFLGPSTQALQAIGTFDSETRSHLAHLAMTWETWPDAAKCFELLSQNCRALKTIIIFWTFEPNIRPFELQDMEDAIDTCIKRKISPLWLDFPVTNGVKSLIRDRLKVLFRSPLEPPEVFYLKR